MSDIEAVKNSNNLKEIIGETVELREVGGRAVGCCPFHSEDTPSFYVTDRTYHCFGCGAGGDVFEWIMQRDGLNFIEALQYLGGTMPGKAGEDPSCVLAQHDPETRYLRCKERLPFKRLAKALAYEAIPAKLRRYFAIEPTVVDKKDELEFLCEYYELGDDYMSKMEALRIWEDLVKKYYFIQW